MNISKYIYLPSYKSIYLPLHPSIHPSIYIVYVQLHTHISLYIHYANNPILELVTCVHASVKQEMLGILKMRALILRQDWVMFSCRPLGEKECKTPSGCSLITKHYVRLQDRTVQNSTVNTWDYIRSYGLWVAWRCDHNNHGEYYLVYVCAWACQRAVASETAAR